MSDGQPMVDRLREEIESVVTQYHSTLLVSYAEVIGILEILKQDVLRELADEEAGA